MKTICQIRFWVYYAISVIDIQLERYMWAKLWLIPLAFVFYELRKYYKK